MIKRITTSTWQVAMLAAAGLFAFPAIAQDPPPAEEPAADEAVEEDPTSEVDPVDDGSGPSSGNNGAPKLGAVGTKKKGEGGNGIALSADGRSRLHLRLDAGAGFDSNPYSIPVGAREGQLSMDIVTRMRPGVTIEHPGGLLSFNGGLFVDYGFLPDVFNGFQEANWLLYQAAANASLGLNRKGMFSFALADTFSWNNDPGVLAFGTSFHRLHNTLKAGVGFRPGGGTLGFRLGYRFGFEKWLDPFLGQPASDAVRNGAFDSMGHTLDLKADWRFLPRTGVFAAVSSGVHGYPLQTTEVNPWTFPVGIRLGVMGQFTPKLSGLVSLGYSNPIVVEGGAVTSGLVIGVTGQAEVRWNITPTTKLAGGIKRVFRPVPLYQYLTNNRVYAKFDQAIGAQFVFGAYAGYSLLEFGPESQVDGSFLTDVGADPDAFRLDGHLDARLDLTYFMYKWLSFGIMNNTDWRLTNASENAPAGVEGRNFSYFGNETLFLASVMY